MSQKVLLSEKELEIISGGDSTFKSVAAVVGISVACATVVAGAHEIAFINDDLHIDEMEWGYEKKSRYESVGKIDKNNNCKMIKNFEQGIAKGYYTCHNGVVDFLRSH